METIIVGLILVILLIGVMYNLDILNIRTRLGSKKGKSDHYKFHPDYDPGHFRILDKNNKVEFSFTLESLESILLIKNDGLVVDTVSIIFQKKNSDPVRFSEDEIDTTELYDKLKIFLKKEDLFIKAMNILEGDVVELWHAQ